MKNEQQEFQNWDDLVFEDRNRSYGAYVLRKSYATHVTEGVAGSIMLAGLLMMVPGILSHWTEKEERSNKQKELSNEGNGLMLNPKIQRVEKVRHTAKASVAKNVIARITTHEVMTEVDTDLPFIDAGGLNENDGDDSGFAAEIPGGNGGIPVIAEAPTVIPTFVEVMPSYAGGYEALLKFFRKWMRYPHSARIMGIEGTVFVQFVINADGDVGEAIVVKGISPDCDKEALRVIRLMPRWNRGMQNHTPTAVRMILPINFRLEK